MSDNPDRNSLQRSLSDSEMDPHLPRSSSSSRTLIIQSSSLSEGGPSSRLWILLSSTIPSDLIITLKYDQDESPAEEVQIHDKVVILTIPALPIDNDTPVNLILSSGSSSTTLPFLYKPLRSSRPASSISQSPLIEFASRSDPLILLEPLSSQIHIIDEEGNNCLHIAARNSQSYALKLLMSALQKEPEAVRRGTINHSNVRGETPLHLAVKSNDADSVHYLVSYNAQITIADRFNNSVLHYLAESHNDAIYKEILERPLDKTHFEAKNDDGLTPLHLAVRRLKLSLIETMVDVCPESIDIIDSKGRTALIHAIEMNDHEIVAFLLSKGANANVEDESGMNALLLSHKVANLVIMGQLLDGGADPGKETKKGERLCDIDDEQVQKIITGERVEQIFKGNENDGIEKRKPSLFGHSEHGGSVEEYIDEDVPGPSNRIRNRPTSIQFGKDDVSCLDYLTRLRLSKVLDTDGKWEILARELDCAHMIELIGICSIDSSPFMILLDQFEQLPNASITRVREALVRMNEDEGVRLLDDRIVY